MTRNYPGRLHIPVCIIPCARYSTANRLVFHSASRQPLLPHYQGPQPTHAHHRLSTQRQQSPPDSHSIRSTDSCYSGTFAPPSAKPYPLHLDTSLMNPGVSRAASTSASSTLVDHSIAGSGNGSRRSSDFARTMPGFRRDRSLQVQDRIRSMSATASSHSRSSLQDHTNPSISRVRAAPGQHGSSTTKMPILNARQTSLMVVRPSTRSHISSRLPIATWLFS